MAGGSNGEQVWKTGQNGSRLPSDEGRRKGATTTQLVSASTGTSGKEMEVTIIPRLTGPLDEYSNRYRVTGPLDRQIPHSLGRLVV